MDHDDVWTVIGDSHFCKGVADELAEKHSQGAEDGVNAEFAEDMQRTS
jgi:hypothetical protein